MKELKGTVMLSEERVKEIFDNAMDSSEAAIGLYSEVIPDITSSKVEGIDGWPSVNKKTAKELIGKFIKLDIEVKRRDGRSFLSGGLWMCNGFGALNGEHLKDWEVSIDGVKVYFKEEAEA